MSKINEQIERLRELIRKCYATVAGKNGTVPEMGERNMENLPAAIASTHDTLEELTITQNGEYTPQEGVDGFSKVVTNVVPSRLVKSSTLKVTNDCIVNGYWAGELVDVSKVTNMSNMFLSCSQLQSLNVSNWDVSGVTTMGYMFQGCSSLQTLDVSNWNVSKVTNTSYMFSICSQLHSLDVSNWDVSNVTTMVTMFYSCSSLQSLIGNLTIDDVLANNIGALNGLKVALSLNKTILDRASLRAVINGLADLTGQTAQTLTLGATLLAKLTEEDIAIATNKNWTIA